MQLVKSKLDFEGISTIENLPDPTTAQQAATKAYVDANSGGGNSVVVDVDFGVRGDFIVQTVPALWVLSTSILMFSVQPNALDHDFEDAILEQLQCTYGNIVVGVSFDLFVHAPQETWGRFKINVIAK